MKPICCISSYWLTRFRFTAIILITRLSLACVLRFSALVSTVRVSVALCYHFRKNRRFPPSSQKQMNRASSTMAEDNRNDAQDDDLNTGDLFKDPEGFYPEEPKPTYAEYRTLSGLNLRVRLVGSHPLYVGLLRSFAFLLASEGNPTSMFPLLFPPHL